MAELSTTLETRLRNMPGATLLRRRRDGWWMMAPDLDVQAMAKLMHALEARLCTMTAVALTGGETAIIYHYAADGEALNFKTRTHGGTMPSIATITRAADWIEREIHDLYAVEFTGHPNLAPLVRPPQLPQGLFRE